MWCGEALSAYGAVPQSMKRGLFLLKVVNLRTRKPLGTPQARRAE
jgi:hypothetical protein